jgi:hypothetical protein
VKPRFAVWWLALVATTALARSDPPISLPIYIEDNHAGAFHWLAQHLDLEEECTLLHFDAHSDASAIFDSDQIRQRLRRVGSVQERAHVLRRWRSAGTIQCFNWIEPLMPAPISELVWIPPPNETNREKQASEAREFLDGHLEAAPRRAGSFKERVRIAGLDDLAMEPGNSRPVVVSLDLDYFSGMSPNERSIQFERVWQFIVERRNLRAIVVAISRPYLADDAESDELLKLVLEGALSLPTARVHFEPFAHVGHDQSLRAREYSLRHQPVPDFNIDQSSPALRALLLADRERIAVRFESNRWEKLLRDWSSEAPEFHLTIKGHQPSTDNIWRIRNDQAVDLEVRAEPWDAEFENVQWVVQLPAYSGCNLVTVDDRAAIFAQGAPPRPRWRDVTLSSHAKVLPVAALGPFFDPAIGTGSLRVKARLAATNWIRETPALELRKSSGSGFRAALTEQFGLPYLFGSGSLRDHENTGPETGWGADCANFLIYALRRQGWRIPWSNPKQFRRHLELVRERITPEDATPLTAAELERGLILHLGSHVAALMEDRPPVGELNGEDIVAHQLEGAPALISVAELLQSRNAKRFDLLRVPEAFTERNILIGGDVMLGRSIGNQLRKGVNPFAALMSVLAGFGTKAINLECVVSDQGAAGKKRYQLRAPTEAASSLNAAGIDVIGVANNHTADFGADALADSVRRLRAAGAAVVGSDDSPHISDRVAFVAVNDVSDSRMVPTHDLVVSAADRPRLEKIIDEARAKTDVVIALVHWGEENTPIITERQRELARWLIDDGVDLIAGSHPHRLQPVDYYHGRPIIYSLGNFVFDGAPTVTSWNKGALAAISLGPKRARNAAIPLSLKLIPIQLDRRGFPHPAETPAVTQR